MRRSWRRYLLVFVIPLMLVLTGADKCSGDSSTLPASTPCSNARDAADALYGVYDHNPTKPNKAAADAAEAHAIKVCNKK